MSATGEGADDAVAREARFLLGVNYWPRRAAMSLWERFDPHQVRDEFETIRSLGMTHVRVFLLWESFQPAPDRVSPTALDRLRTLCDIAAGSELEVQVTFFTGHMSGPNWAPAWLLDRTRPRSTADRQVVGLARPAGDAHGVLDVYRSPLVLSAEDLLIGAVCRELRDHPAVWAWSLGNEPDLFCRPANVEHSTTWIRHRAAVIRAIDPDRPVLIGLHAAAVESDVGFRVDRVAEVTDISVMHAYPFYSGVARSALDPDYVPFMCGLTAALAGRPVLFEEFGVNTQLPDGPSGWRDIQTWDRGTRRVHFASETDAADYVDAVLTRLVRMGALGAFMWCFADYASELWGRPPLDFQVHERHFGLIRPDGSLKPSAEVIRRFAARHRAAQAPERRVDLGMTVDEFYADPGGNARRLYESFGTLPPGAEA